MELIVLVFFSLVPAVGWVWYFKRYDRLEPEPNRMLARTFAAGLLAVVPAGLIEVPLMQAWGQGTNAVGQFVFLILGVGLVEESAKLMAVYFAAYRSPEFGGSLDGIIYMTTAAFGFAAAENFLYAYSFGWEIGPLRAIVTTIAHASFSGVVGFSLGLVHSGAGTWITVASSLISVSILHGLYNYILFSQFLSPLLALLLVFLLYRFLTHRIRQAQKRI